MSKGIRTLLSIGAVSAILGLVLSVAGLCTGGRLTNIRIYWHNGPRVEYRDAAGDAAFGMGILDSGMPEAPAAPDAPEPPDAPAAHHQEPAHGGAVSGEVRELDIEIGGGRVEIRTGDDCGLRVQGSPRYKSDLSGDEWEIHTEEGWNAGINWDDVLFTITLPADTVLDELSLTIGAGTLTADALRCHEADLKVGAGTMTLDGFVCLGDCEIDVGMGTLQIDDGALWQTTEVECGMGTVKMKLARPDAYGYEVSGGMGSVSIDGNSYSGMSIDAKRNTDADTFYQIKCGMGSVKLEFLNR